MSHTKIIANTTNPTNKSAIAPIAARSKADRRMLGLSLHGWENGMVLALIIAGFFALIAGAATWAVVRLTRLELADSKRELDAYKVDAEKKVAASAAIGETAKADASKANESAERAKAEAAKANLELAKIKAPRLLSAALEASLIAEIKRYSKTPVVFGVFQDPEALGLLDQLSKALLAAGWTEEEWKSGGDIALTRGGSHPTAGFTSVAGVYVQADAAHANDFGPIVSRLAKLLSDAGIEAKAEVGRMAPDTNNNAIKILIGQKPR
jgi:hypothetical protein